MEHGLSIVEQKPEAVVVAGKDAATQLQKIVGSRQKKLMMGGKQYLFFEDWQTIGKFYGVTARVSSTSELRENDQLIGFLASAVALAGGVEISGADAECTYDEPNWTSKPRYQLRSMAQTRACAKALRNCLGWVAVLAGYEATPAEEMSGVKQEKTGHFCEEHGVPFFKKGKMKSYAHKIEETGEWCNEETAEPAPEGTESKSSPIEEVKGTTLKMLAEKATEKGYDPTEVKAIMASLFHAGSAKDLSQEQRQELLDVMDKGDYKEPETLQF